MQRVWRKNVLPLGIIVRWHKENKDDQWRGTLPSVMSWVWLQLVCEKEGAPGLSQLHSGKSRMNEPKAENPGPGKGHWLVFKCGHTTPDPMVKPSKKGAGGGRRCPTCKSKLIDKIFTCCDCGGSFHGGVPMSWKRSRCSKCAGVKKNTRVYPQKKGDLRPKTSGKRYHTAKSDCTFYESKCLPQAAIKNQNCVPCQDCPDYTPVPMHAMINGGGNEYQVDNHGCPTNWAM